MRNGSQEKERKEGNYINAEPQKWGGRNLKDDST
jgi:hypothetical protein